MMAWEVQLPGYIFMCNGKTKPDCYRYRVFGLPDARLQIVKKIKPNTKLFLFDFDIKLLYGVYSASSTGGLGLEPAAFDGKFQAQVKFEIFKECLPLPESAFKHVLKDNYNGGSKFRQELSDEQVMTLISMFRPIAGSPMSLHALPDSKFLASYDRYLAQVTRPGWSLHSREALLPSTQVPHAMRVDIAFSHPGTRTLHMPSMETTAQYAPENPTLIQPQTHCRFVTVPGNGNGRMLQLPASARGTASYWVGVASEDQKHAYIPEQMLTTNNCAGSYPSYGSGPGDHTHGNVPQSVIASYHNHELALRASNATVLQHQVLSDGAMQSRSSSSAAIGYPNNSNQGYPGSTGVDAGNVIISYAVRALNDVSVPDMAEVGVAHDMAASAGQTTLPANIHVPQQLILPPHVYTHGSFSSREAVYWGAVAPQAQDPMYFDSTTYAMSAVTMAGRIQAAQFSNDTFQV